MLPVNAIGYSVSARLAGEHPDRAILEGQEYSFDVEAFAGDGQCRIHILDKVHSQVAAEWDGSGRQLSRSIENAWLAVQWKTDVLDVLLMKWSDGDCTTRFFWILADNSELAERFL